jgi:alkylated DNA nucleotide flippase Atl1
MQEFKQLIIEEVNKLGPLEACSYSYIGRQVGTSGWIVGKILTSLSVEECEDLAWYKVVAKDGYISAMKLGLKGQLQKSILEEKGFIIIEDSISPEFMIG